jgi:protease I
MRMDENAVAFVRSFFERGKPVAAICHAPWIGQRVPSGVSTA